MRLYATILATSALLATACSNGPIDTLSYDMSKSSAAMAASDGAYPEVLDACWLSGKEISVFVGHVTSIGDIETPLQNCPDPTYFTDYRAATVDVVDTAIGKAPRDNDTFHIVGSTGVPLVLLNSGDHLLMAARWWAPEGVWIVLETVGVAINGGSTAISAPAPERAVDLPTGWDDLETDLKQSRQSDCKPKALYSEYDDAKFDEQILRRGQENYDRRCSGWTPDAADPGDPDSTDPREHDGG